MPISVKNSAGVDTVISTIDDLIAIVGQGASPAANTMQARLESLKTFVDGLEGLLGTTNGSLTTIAGYTDTLESLITTLNGYVDGLETLVGSSNAKLDTLHTDLAAATVGTTAPGTDAGGLVGMQGAANMVPVASVGKSLVFDVTLSASTGAQAVGTLIADTQVLTNLFRISDGTAWLNSIQIIDKDDLKQAIDVYILDANVSMGTEGSAVSISDASAVSLYGPFSIAAADYKDLGGVSVASLRGIGQTLKAVSGSRNAYIAAVCASGTPTYTAAGLIARLGLSLD
jgi:hypothetical protein